MDNLIQSLAIYALPVIFAITVHEAAHGYVARHFGDTTAWRLGRVSLNPLRHVDPIGTILVPGLLLATGSSILFGWAKPVPVNFSKLRRPKQDMLWVAAAGPAANLLMAFGWAALVKFAEIAQGLPGNEVLFSMGRFGIRVNASLMLLNLLPIPPLDGGRIAVSLLPHDLAWKFARLEPYGFVIILALLFTDILPRIIAPLHHGFVFLLNSLFNL